MIAYESEHVRLDGTTFPVAVELTGDARTGCAGALRWLTWIDDLTERRRAEEAAARHAAGSPAPTPTSTASPRSWRTTSSRRCA